MQSVGAGGQVMAANVDNDDDEVWDVDDSDDEVLVPNPQQQDEVLVPNPQQQAQPRTAPQPQFPPTDQDHLSIVGELRTHMAEHGLNQHRLGERIARPFTDVSDWLCGRLGERSQAKMDARVAAYLCDPTTFAVTFAAQLAAKVQPSQAMLRQAVEDFVPWTTRPHAELVAEVKAHMASEKLSQASLAQRIARSSGHVSQWMTGRLGASAGLDPDIRAFTEREQPANSNVSPVSSHPSS